MYKQTSATRISEDGAERTFNTSACLIEVMTVMRRRAKEKGGVSVPSGMTPAHLSPPNSALSLADNTFSLI
jgi:hypothetical protein